MTTNAEYFEQAVFLGSFLGMFIAFGIGFWISTSFGRR